MARQAFAKDDLLLTIRFPTLTRVSKTQPVLRSRIPVVLLHENVRDAEILEQQLGGIDRMKSKQLHHHEIKIRQFLLRRNEKQRITQRNHDMVYRLYGEKSNTTQVSKQQSKPGYTKKRPDITADDTEARMAPQLEQFPEMIMLVREDMQIEREKDESHQEQLLQQEETKVLEDSEPHKTTRSAIRSDHDRDHVQRKQKVVHFEDSADSDLDNAQDKTKVKNKTEKKMNADKFSRHQ